MRIHAFSPSPRAFKVLAVASHLGLDHELRLVDLTKGEQARPEFVALNPNRKMPVLETSDGGVLWESNAIIMHLSAMKPDSGLLGADEATRALVLQWLFWESTTWDPPCATLLFERFVKGFISGGAADPTEVEKGLRKFEFAAGVLDGHLKGRHYVCGEALTLADFSLGASLTIAELAQLPLAQYREISRWADGLASLPAWQATRALQAPEERAA